MQKTVNHLLKNLEKRKIGAKYFDSVDAAKKEILAELNSCEDVGIGGSKTIMDMELHKDLKEAGKNIYWHWLVKADEQEDVRRKALNSDVYLSSTNAITMDGELVNIDGIGNRVSGMYYGPKKVIVICGINKICSDIISACDRIKTKACPPNAKRLGLQTPCAITGVCNDCQSKERMCNITVIINHKPMLTDLNVYIVGENLGF
mgnify:CR=1 FL=1